MDYYERFYKEHHQELEKEGIRVKVYPGTGAGVIIHKELNYAIPMRGCAYCCRGGMKKDIMVMSYIDGYLEAKGECSKWEGEIQVRDIEKIKDEIYDAWGVEDKEAWR